MKYFILLLVILVLGSCGETKPYVKHELKFEKVNDNCTGMTPGVRMNSNINGERFELQRCLDADFTKEMLTSVRNGDTVILAFERKNTRQSLYNIIIDLDVYPRYRYIMIDDQFAEIQPAGN